MITETTKFVYKCTKDFTGGLMDISRSISLDVSSTGIRSLDISPAVMEVRTEIEFELEGYVYDRTEVTRVETEDQAIPEDETPSEQPQATEQSPATGE